MADDAPQLRLDSRVQLFSALSEAAELEHNLMCMYLYAAFGLKSAECEGVSAEQLQAIKRWRRVVLGIALEEMNHLTLVSNLMTAIGGSPNFMRPNFPASPGMYPADMVMELAPFDLSTIEHCMYLERPEAREVADGESFPHVEHYVRRAPEGRLMPHASDYATVGSLYRAIREAIGEMSTRMGEERLFSGAFERQLGPLDSTLPGLTLVSNLESALRALDTIVIQGEGALSEEGSHFARFQEIHAEYSQWLAQDPAFAPSRPVARNPVMREPISPADRVWVRQPLAARYMDLANTVYTFMLRLMTQIYVIENRAPASKQALIQSSIDAMHAMASVAETLTHLSADENPDGVRAGMSFAMVRSLAPLDSQAETALLTERLEQIVNGFDELQAELENKRGVGAPPQECIDELKRCRSLLNGCRERILNAPFAKSDAKPNAVKLPLAPPAPAPAPAPAPMMPSPTGEEVAHGTALTIHFDAKRCIHSRHCVTELPRVFKANTPGTWLFPDEADGDVLAAVIRECPSGALHYDAHQGDASEAAPEVNVIRLFENGPYAVLAELEVGGVAVGYRATLCRCGHSQHKPFCDGSHHAVSFQATGEPAAVQTDALAERAGALRIDPTENGPLALSGNVEICAGTGHIVLRTSNARLCRCGQSKTKPLCDGSHVAAGFDSKNAPASNDPTKPRLQ